MRHTTSHTHFFFAKMISTDAIAIYTYTEYEYICTEYTTNSFNTVNVYEPYKQCNYRCIHEIYWDIEVLIRELYTYYKHIDSIAWYNAYEQWVSHNRERERKKNSEHRKILTDAKN